MNFQSRYSKTGRNPLSAVICIRLLRFYREQTTLTSTILVFVITTAVPGCLDNVPAITSIRSATDISSPHVHEYSYCLSPASSDCARLTFYLPLAITCIMS